MRLLEVILAIAVAYCLSTVGEALLGRWSNTLAEWNVSFLVGLALTSTAFFPLSLLFPANALNVTAACLVLSGILRAVLRRIAAGGALPPAAHFSHFGSIDGVTPKILLVLTILPAVQFAIQNYRLFYLWDGYQIWAAKALVLEQ